jgi:hypothetical protein
MVEHQRADRRAQLPALPAALDDRVQLADQRDDSGLAVLGVLPTEGDLARVTVNVCPAGTRENRVGSPKLEISVARRLARSMG